MPIFEEVRLAWGGQDCVIPPDQLMTVIAKIEEVITMAELSRAVERNALPHAKLAIAFGRVLRHGGVRVTDEEVYNGMLAPGQDQKMRAMSALNALLTLMLPPESVRAALAEAKPAGKPPAAAQDQ